MTNHFTPAEALHHLVEVHLDPQSCKIVKGLYGQSTPFRNKDASDPNHPGNLWISQSNLAQRRFMVLEGSNFTAGFLFVHEGQFQVISYPSQIMDMDSSFRFAGHAGNSLEHILPVAFCPEELRQNFLKGNPSSTGWKKGGLCHSN